ncbi:hypothetical protein Moror_15827 [Moniliophthora roreri MCA 2997]|uniref:Uncharacterized protein n=1 Tax=Moniliophthora roreri (strain MCA 2997) TaxID=1381753 RepID=V2WJF3_MONRO|nr:hypothetical protein Moror_15827 [Moniliophthora roreri MCA 2997]
MFNRSSQFSVKGENTFNHVHGDQTIINLNTQEVKRTEYDEFEYVKRGHVISIQELGFINTADWNWNWQGRHLVGRHKARKTIWTVELVDRKSKYTTMIYEGEDAESVWEADFRRFSRNK